MALPERQLTSFVFQMKCAITIHFVPNFQHFVEISTLPSLNYTVVHRLMSQWNKDFIFLCEQNHKTYNAHQLINKLFSSAEQFVVKSLLDPMLFCSVVSLNGLGSRSDVEKFACFKEVPFNLQTAFEFKLCLDNKTHFC